MVEEDVTEATVDCGGLLDSLLRGRPGEPDHELRRDCYFSEPPKRLVTE